MSTTKPLYLRISIIICHLVSNIAAAIHYFFFARGLIKFSSVITEAPGGVYKNLRRIWYVRLFRRIVSVLVRTSMGRQLLQLINMNTASEIGPGAVIVSCHTPWARLFARWCTENNYAMIVGWGPWTKRTIIARQATGFNELRTLVNHLRSGGRIIVMADVFNDLNDCPVQFLEEKRNASLFPIRLANVANSLLLTVMPVLENNTIRIHAGPRVRYSNAGEAPGNIMQTVLAYFEKEIKQRPFNWLGYIRGSLSK